MTNNVIPFVQSASYPGRPRWTFDVLDRAAARGIDVRVIFWRPDAKTEWLRRNAFWGSKTRIDLLDGRRSGVKVRWYCAHPGFCQHQKSWLVDAGTENETAFVGGEAGDHAWKGLAFELDPGKYVG